MGAGEILPRNMTKVLTAWSATTSATSGSLWTSVSLLTSGPQFLISLLLHISILCTPLYSVEAGNSVVHRVRQYNPNCLLLTGEEAEECEAARVSSQLDGVPWWTWLLLGIVLLLILLVVVRAYCSWKSQPQEKRVRRSCSREVKSDGRLQSRTKVEEEEEEVNNCYVPPPPSTPPLGPKMSWQGSPLPTCSLDYDLPGSKGASVQPSRISTDLSRQGAASRSSIYV